jgi:integrase
VTWGTTVNRLEHLTNAAAAMVGIRLRQRSDLTPESWARLVAALAECRYQRRILAATLNMFGIERADRPLYPLPPPREKRGQTRPISDAVMEQIIRAAIRWEAKIPELVRLKRAFRRDDQWAVANGIANRKRLRHASSCGQAAGMALLLAATGMRISELLSLQKGAGKDGGPDDPEGWWAWGTAYKFNGGQGRRTRWFGGQMGRRGYRILCALSPARDLCVTHFKTPTVLYRVTAAERIRILLKEEGIEADVDGLRLHPHRFRRTFARAIFKHGATELGLKEQMQHKDIDMTDHYVGSDPETYKYLFGEDAQETAEALADTITEGLRA